MGLDNGVTIKGKTEKGEKFLKKYFKHAEEDYLPGYYEFGYWRKCWNIRARFFEYLPNSGEEDELYYYFSIEDIPTIVDKVLKYFLDEDHWEYNDCHSQIFTWAEELPSVACAIKDLRDFYELCTSEEEDDIGEVTDTDFEIYFYDSY